MANEIVDDPMEIAPAEYGAPVGDPQIEGTDSQQIDQDMVMYDETNGTPNFDIFRSFKDANKSGDKNDANDRENEESYDLNVLVRAVDIDCLTSCYVSTALVIRLNFIRQHCSPLRHEALVALIRYYRFNTENITSYLALHSELAEVEAATGSKANVNRPQLDEQWVEETKIKTANFLEYLQTEYKRQKDEGVKESTRRAMEDLFQHYRSCGMIEDALRLYGRGIRDYCTQSKHFVNMYNNWIELAIAAGEWAKVDSIAQQALRTLRDAESAEKAHTQSRQEISPYVVDRDSASAVNINQSNRVLIDSSMAKILTVQALVKLRQKKFKSTAEKIFEIKLDNLEAKWFVCTADLGVYAMLCSLASYPRTVLKKKAIEEDAFRKLMECEPVFYEMLQAYTSSKFGRVFELMDSVQSRLLLDPFISRSVVDLFAKIRQKCVIQYISPYSVINIENMSNALGYSRAEIESVVIELIENENIQVKIDQINGMIRLVKNKDEKSTHGKVLEVCEKTIQKTHVILWKAILSQANIVGTQDKSRARKKPLKDVASTSKMEMSPLSNVENKRDSFDNIRAPENINDNENQIVEEPRNT